MEVFVDGGIMRGMDIFKALCLGARAVGIGRGFLYALNYGREGVEKYVDSESFLPFAPLIILCAPSIIATLEYLIQLFQNSLPSSP
jgi:glutamate synthase domain-containing protein 2